MVEFQRALEIREQISGRLNEGTAKCYLWVGSIFWHKDQYEKALDNFSRSFRIRLELSGSKGYFGIDTNWINKVLDVQGIVDKDVYWRKFMSCIEHERRGDKLMAEGMYDHAIEEYRTALQFELRRRGLSANTPGRPLADAADLYLKIAQTYVEQENFVRAMMEFRQALSIYLAKFGRHQRYSIETYENMAYVGHMMGFRVTFVNDYLESIYQSILHEKTADMLLERKENLEALDEYGKALKLEEAGIGKLQVQCAMIYLKVAKACTRLGRQRSSLMFCCKALGIFDSALGSGHRNTITAMKIIQAITSGANFEE
jgi:tetratricopeptide (TPR) repeat protein